MKISKTFVNTSYNIWGGFLSNNMTKQQAKTVADAARWKAVDFLGSKYSALTDPFQTAITAYALHVAGHREKENAFRRLETMKRQGTYIQTVDPIGDGPGGGG